MDAVNIHHTIMNNGMMIPCLGYADAPAAIEWLCKAFGFEKHLVVPGPTPDIITHSELRLGEGMIMVGSRKSGTLFSQHIKNPSEVDGFETQAPYIVIEDIEAHYNTAVEAGAKIVDALKKEDYGGSTYSCLDPEGHFWTFGSYDPLEE